MAQMIPDHLGENTKSDAEKKLFRLFRGMENTDNWVILHSLMIADHTTQTQGEADFVVIIPSSGVFVLEVKGGRISQLDGSWYSTNRYNETNKINPVVEANEAMHSIKNYVKSSSNWNTKPPLFGFGVVFPGTSIHGKYNSIEIADEQVADIDDCSSPQMLRSYLMRLSMYWKKHTVTNAIYPDADQCKTIVKILRPNVVGKVSLRALIRTVEGQEVELTDNQQDIFETIKENDRCIVKGDAGTGKTIIALNYAKELSASGEKTGFFCYNKQLADYLKSNVDCGDSLICDSFTEYMESVVERSGAGSQAAYDNSTRDKYFEKILPQLFIEAFLELEMPQFKTLILDEAQDLMKEHYLDALDLVLEGGIQNGRWYLFMDADKQNLFQMGTKESDILEQLKKYHANYTKCALRDNCRNSVAIIEKVDSVFGLKTRHKNNDERGAEVVIKSYKNTADQVEILESVLETLKQEDIPRKEIVILSPLRFANSAASLVTGISVTTDSKNRAKSVYFSTIQSFKGLESSVVILIDIDEITLNDSRMDIVYVGMTRPKSVLYILVKDKVAKKLR